MQSGKYRNSFTGSIFHVSVPFWPSKYDDEMQILLKNSSGINWHSNTYISATTAIHTEIVM